MKFEFIPKTPLGKWSVGLTVIFLVFVLLIILVPFGDNLFIIIPFILAAISGIAMLVFSILGIIFEKERAVLVFLSVVIGLVAIGFFLGDVIIR
jgi:hypothetical protein